MFRSSDPAHDASLAKLKRAGNFRGSARVERELARDVLNRADAGKPRRRSRNSRNAWLNDERRDEKIFKFINNSLRLRCPVRVTSSMSDTVLRAAEKRREFKARSVPLGTIPPVGLPHWDHASPRLKMIGWGLAMHARQGRTFNLKLSDAVIRRAKSSPRGVTKYLQDRVRKELRSALAQIGRKVPEFWFAVEQGTIDTVHLHGAIEGVADTRSLDAIKKGLRAAGGRNVKNQLTMKALIRPVTWVGYATKWHNLARFHVGPPGELIENVSVFAASNGCRAAAQRCYQDLRTRSVTIYP
jgi:hypothetical protein